MKKIGSFLFLLSFSVFSSAGPFDEKATPYVHIKQLSLELINDGRDRLVISGTRISNSKCSNRNVLMIFDKKDDLSRELIRTLVDAKGQDLIVQLVSGGCRTIEAHSYPVINRVRIK